MPALPCVDVLFQRVTDVVYKVSDGTAQLGITGLDVVREHPHEDLVVIHEDLRYGYCKLLVAVPEAWVDVETMIDLTEVALDFREYKRRNLRVATTYSNLARQFLHDQGIHHFTLVNAEGAIEAAPTIGYADIIVDLVQTGTTLRENHLKALPDGVIVEVTGVSGRQPAGAARQPDRDGRRARHAGTHRCGASGAWLFAGDGQYSRRKRRRNRPPDRRQPDHAWLARTHRRANSRNGKRLAHCHDYHL